MRDYLIEIDESHLFENETPGRKWNQGFMSRWHSGLSKTTATNIASLKVASYTPLIFARYFAILKKTLWFGEKRSW